MAWKSFERMGMLPIHALVEDDMAVSGRELAILVDRAMSEYDANDPALHLYQDG